MSFVNEWAVLQGLISKGSVGLGSTYLEGSWATTDLATFLELAVRNTDARSHSPKSLRWRARLQRWWAKRPQMGRTDVIAAIGDHYDLGNNFYGAWLDATMTYSAALFEDYSEDLAVAQERKYERLCQLLELKPGERVLEIGCGWGGFAHHAALNHDVHVTGLTLSTEQAAYARNRLARAGLVDKTEIKIQDFRDEKAMYDKVVSIEMIESVDETLWPSLFHAISRALPPGGKAAMQAITIDEPFYESLLRRDDFIKTYIFPGGALPSIPALEKLVSDAGLVWLSAEAHGPDYAETLQRWAAQFEKIWPDVVDADPAFDEHFHRMWRYYLEYCEAGFRTGRLDGYQILMERPSPPDM
jgi:cyclopropane-fatty-acyl-phospholipid synthase